jgi:Uma2 family endonuclease
MGSVPTPTRMTPDEFLAWESTQQERHEYIGGEIFAMTGARVAHNLIVGNAYVFLRQTLRGRPCQVFASDLKLQIDAAAVFVYPDVMVTCDPRDTAGGGGLSIRHPWLIVEVLSESASAFDRGGKFELYRKVESLTHYLLVEQTRPYAELFRKNAQGEWVLQPLAISDSLNIERPHAFDWPVATLFDGVPFEPGEPVMVAR